MEQSNQNLLHKIDRFVFNRNIKDQCNYKNVKELISTLAPFYEQQYLTLKVSQEDQVVNRAFLLVCKININQKEDLDQQKHQQITLLKAHLKCIDFSSLKSLCINIQVNNIEFLQYLSLENLQSLSLDQTFVTSLKMLNKIYCPKLDHLNYKNHPHFSYQFQLKDTDIFTRAQIKNLQYLSLQRYFQNCKLGILLFYSKLVFSPNHQFQPCFTFKILAKKPFCFKQIVDYSRNKKQKINTPEKGQINHFQKISVQHRYSDLLKYYYCLILLKFI